MRSFLVRLVVVSPLMLGACVETQLPADGGYAGRADPYVYPTAEPEPQDFDIGAPAVDPQQAARNFVSVLSRVEPVAEAECARRAPNVDCDYQIVVDDRLDLPPNAGQTLDRTGRPVIIFTLALIAEARNTDELALILGHEASHHIQGHLTRQSQSATVGGVLAGSLGQAIGADAAMVDALRNLGAGVGSRRYSKDMELEADVLGTYIAWAAGYDPDRGVAFFSRIPDPGNQFLGTHPGNAQRVALIRDTAARLRGG